MEERKPERFREISENRTRWIEKERERGRIEEDREREK